MPCSKHVVMDFKFSRKDFITRLTLGRNLRNGVRLRCLAEGILFPQENLQALLVKLYIIDY